jgi:hypothetical protein
MNGAEIDEHIKRTVLRALGGGALMSMIGLKYEIGSGIRFSDLRQILTNMERAGQIERHGRDVFRLRR